MTKLPKVALIGRANVGKSTLFNTLNERKKAIVSNIAGTTRDRNYSSLSWRGLTFELIDTGGLDIVHPQDIEKDIIKQAKIALKEAELILFLVDIKDGLMPQDKEVAKILQTAKKSVILVVNKADNKKLKESTAEFFKLSLGDPLPISAINGSGTGDLLDEIVKNLKPSKKKVITSDSEPSVPIKIAIIGKPNTGKSTLVNSILGQERVITSATPYTTRDTQNIDLTYKDQVYSLIDTAGVRKKARIKDKLEKYSVSQALASIKKADVTLLMTDVSKPMGKQDKTLSDEIQKGSSSLIIVANKWDLIEDKDEKTIGKFIKYYQRFFPYLSYAPIIFISAKEKQRDKKVLELAKEVYLERFREITDNALSKFLKKLLKKQLPSRGKGTKQPRIYGIKQLGVDPPRFEVVKDPISDLHASYPRFIKKQLREKFGFLGTPIIIKVRKLKG